MRLLFAAVLLTCLVQVGGASAKSTNGTWHYFHIHANAYGDWGSCSADWHANGGGCTGKMEAGSFLGHQYRHGFKVHWGWEGDKLEFTLYDPTWHPVQHMRGTKPHNWFTYTVANAYLIPKTTESIYYESGSTAAAGHEGGPLFVNLSSHSDIFHKGYSIDLRGYLRRK